MPLQFGGGVVQAQIACSKLPIVGDPDEVAAAQLGDDVPHRYVLFGASTQRCVPSDLFVHAVPAFTLSES